MSPAIPQKTTKAEARIRTVSEEIPMPSLDHGGGMVRTVEIAVEQTAYHFDKLYTYILTDTLGGLERGCRVLVPFGGGNRRRQGVVMAFGETAETKGLKPVLSVLDEQPLLNDEMLALAEWLKERTFCTLFEAVRCMLPAGLSMRVHIRYRIHPDLTDEVREVLSDEEKRMLDQVRARCMRDPNGAEREKLLQDLGLARDSDLPERLQKKGCLLRDEGAFRVAGDATMRMVRLAVSEEEAAGYQNSKVCTPKQKAVLSLLMQTGGASIKELCYFAGVTAAVPAALEKKGLLLYVDQEVLRSPNLAEKNPEICSTPLNPEQQIAFEGLLEQYRSGKASCALLYGVTGSGKTQVYMNLIDRVLEDGRQVLVLVPEISLTPQTLNLFISRYGRRVAVLHSGLSVGERMDEWKRIKRGDACIVVGTRSAVFAPCSNIGLIVMDEEQEHTYKSESSPRYHARDVAKFRCARHRSLLLLTSATPCVESYYAARMGRYSLHTLRNRFGDVRLPQVDVVDMRQEDDRTVFSKPLLSEIRSCLDSGRQAILLLNRRGFNTFVSCRACGHVISCPSCSISMTYHRANGLLVCHYCGHMQDPVSTCPECGSDRIRYSGLGTQRAEQELAALFPEAAVLRMDTDTTMSRFAYEKRFRDFSQGKYQILIGTQMVAKGLDFPHVGLVGVLSADQALYGDDFRCFETTFSLLTQVIGRAGRRELPGRAIIQTYTPENYVIGLAARQDYEGFFRLEIEARKMMKYPPFSDLCLFGFVGSSEELVRKAAHRYLELLKETVTQKYPSLPVIVLDPTPAVISKAAGKFRYKILMKTVNTIPMRKMVGDLLQQYQHLPESKSATIFVDINPAGVL